MGFCSRILQQDRIFGLTRQEGLDIHGIRDEALLCHMSRVCHVEEKRSWAGEELQLAQMHRSQQTCAWKAKHPQITGHYTLK